MADKAGRAERRTDHELHAAVRDYFTMLEGELRRRTAPRGLLARYALTPQADRATIERRFQSICTILIEHGLPYLNAYPPRGGYSEALVQAVEHYLQNHVDLLQLMENDVYRPVVEPAEPEGRYLEEIFRAPPQPGEIPGRPQHTEGAPLLSAVDYLGREQRNRSLSLAGEQFVVALEQRRLIEAGCDVFAENIEHVSGEFGEGLGYDIHSYEIDGRDRFIEVKTTRFRKETPFYVSTNEVAVSRRHRERFWIYRVYDFRSTPYVYCVNGALTERFRLEPQEYRAAIR